MRRSAGVVDGVTSGPYRRPTVDVEEVAALASEPVARLPVLVKGRLLTAAPLSPAEAEATSAAAGDGAVAVPGRNDVVVLRRAVAGGSRLVALPRPAADDLIEADPGELAGTLYRLSSADVLDYVGAVRNAVGESGPLIAALAGAAKGVSPAADFGLDVLVAGMAELLDPAGMAAAVDRELGSGNVPGRRYLDGWVRTPAETWAGPTARLAHRLFEGVDGDGRDGRDGGEPDGAPWVRAMPTRQLHITSGNAPVVPLVSALRAFATKGAAVIKCPAASTLATTVLAVAMSLVDPEHPITRHTSLVYWSGGDAALEGRLLAPGAFDRIVVWGSQATVDSVRERTGSTRTIALGPRVGVSLIGREGLGASRNAVVARAASDSMVLDQQGCMSSLVHYVEGDEEDALAYCHALADVLARWDDALPQPGSRERTGRLRRLRRGRFVDGTWFDSRSRTGTGSVVVSMPHGFDLSVHPLARVVVVRSVDRLGDAVRLLGSDVSTVGVYPEDRRHELRDELAARGVSHVVPLGQCERTFAGMPQDGMRLLGELVSWATA